MADVIISYEEYQSLLSGKSRKERDLLDKIESMEVRYWKIVEEYNDILIKIIRYEHFDRVNSYLRSSHKTEISSYRSGSEGKEIVKFGKMEYPKLYQ
jgi:hypothetical protein